MMNTVKLFPLIRESKEVLKIDYFPKLLSSNSSSYTEVTKAIQLTFFFSRALVATYMTEVPLPL